MKSDDAAVLETDCSVVSFVINAPLDVPQHYKDHHRKLHQKQEQGFEPDVQVPLSSGIPQVLDVQFCSLLFDFFLVSVSLGLLELLGCFSQPCVSLDPHELVLIKQVEGIEGVAVVIFVQSEHAVFVVGVVQFNIFLFIRIGKLSKLLSVELFFVDN